MLNRAALIVRPATPYIEWARKLDDSGLTPDRGGEHTVYLVSDLDNRTEEAVLKLVYAEVFARELFAWHTDEADWPKKRTLAMFKSWFDIELHSVVEDMCGYEIEDDEAEDEA